MLLEHVLPFSVILQVSFYIYIYIYIYFFLNSFSILTISPSSCAFVRTKKCQPCVYTIN